MNKIEEITKTLQTEIDDSKIISQLTELYQVYLQEKNENHGFINNYLINLNLPLILCKSIKQNFSQINQNWFIAYQLSCFLLDIILSSNNTNLNDFQMNIIIDSHLILLKRLQKNYLLKKESIINLETTKDEYLNVIRLILNNFKKIIQYSTKIVYLLLKSPWFLQLFITDNKEFSLLLIEFFIVCINLSPESFDRLKHSLKIDILDELIYHLSIMNNSEMIQKIIKSLVVLLIKIPGLSKTIVKRYRGIQLLLMKWLNQFTNKSNGVVSTKVSMETTQTILDKNEACRLLLTQLIDLINESQIPTAKEKKSEMIVNRKKTLENKNIDVRQAAIIIQSNWRGYSDRKKIKRMNESIGLLQRHFREHQLKKLENEQQVQLEKDFQIMITMNRHKRYREKLETEIKLWSSLPGCLVENEWNKERELAAIFIQRHYRGYCARKYLKNQRDYLKRDKAARTIQLNFRKYLSRLECASSGKTVFKIDPTENNLINNKKLEITIKEVLREHRKWCETHQQSMRLINQLEDVHKETQIKIGQYRRDYQVNSIKSQTRQVTLTRMKIDADLLLNEFTEEDKQLKNEIKHKKTTTLNEIVDKHIENSDLTNAFSQFTCRVQPLARLAQMEHHDRMTRMNLNKSWWNIFMDEWRKKQDEYIQSHNKNFSDLTDTDVTNQNVDSYDLSWLPDRFIEELERRDIFQR